jgi:hypothetical protein
MFNAFLEPCSHSGMRTNEERVVAAVALFGTITLSSTEVTDYSIRRQPVARLTYDSTKHELSVQAKVSGDQFPACESFIDDGFGHGVFLGGFSPDNKFEILRLYGQFNQATGHPLP